MVPCVCWVIDHKRRQNVVRTSVTSSGATFLFLPHFDVTCDLLLNRCMETRNLFVKFITAQSRDHDPHHLIPKNGREGERGQRWKMIRLLNGNISGERQEEEKIQMRVYI